MKAWQRWVLRILLFLFVVIFVVPMVIPLPTVGGDARALADDGGAFVEIVGIDTYYVEMGPDEGQAVLLAHGLGGSTYSWRENMATLAEAGYRVVAYDRPPFGLTEKSDALDVSAPAQARFAVALLDALGIDSAVLVGHSAGGGVIAQMALQYPQRVDGLVFVAGAVGTPNGAPSGVGDVLGFAPFNRWLRIGARLLLTPERYGDLLASAYGDPTIATETVRDEYAKVLQVRDWDVGFATLIRDSGRNAFPLDRLNELTQPALLIWGREDTWVPLDRGETLAAALPDATLLIYDDVGHLAMEEAPERFNADLMDWLLAIGS
jgi:pimeloyl-ACP methyl ester carboxylesterase